MHVITFTNVVGRILCIHPCLSVTLQNRIFLYIGLSVCLFVCLLVCLSVLERSTGHKTGPIFLKCLQRMDSTLSTMAKLFGQNWIKVKVNGSTFVKFI